jgi:UPF0716 protein FxsA
MPFIIFFLLISLPVLEVASIVQVSRWIGPVLTFLLLAAGVALGMFLIRSQSLLVGRRVMEAMRTGSPPEKPLLDSGMISFAGVLFMIPGFFTDILAILLLIPAARRKIWGGMAYGFRGRSQSQRTQKRPEPEQQKPQRADDVIDVEFTEVQADTPPASGTATQRGDSPWNKG